VPAFHGLNPMRPRERRLGPFHAALSGPIATLRPMEMSVKQAPRLFRSYYRHRAVVCRPPAHGSKHRPVPCGAGLRPVPSGTGLRPVPSGTGLRRPYSFRFLCRRPPAQAAREIDPACGRARLNRLPKNARDCHPEERQATKDLCSCLILQLPRFFASPRTVRSRASLRMTARRGFFRSL
jgi:hypothetical protein